MSTFVQSNEFAILWEFLKNEPVGAQRTINNVKDKLKNGSTPVHERLFRKLCGIDINNLTYDNTLSNVGIRRLSKDALIKNVCADFARRRNEFQETYKLAVAGDLTVVHNCWVSENTLVEVIACLIDVTIYQLPINSKVEMTRNERQSVAGKNRKAKLKNGARGNRLDFMIKAFLGQKWNEIIYAESGKEAKYYLPDAEAKIPLRSESVEETRIYSRFNGHTSRALFGPLITAADLMKVSSYNRHTLKQIVAVIMQDKNFGFRADYVFGIMILTVALVLSCFMGLYQEMNRSNDWREGLFYTHFLALPLFLIFYDDIKSQVLLLNESLYVSLEEIVNDLSGGKIFASFNVIHNTTSYCALPRTWLYLIMNVLTQYLCISGVHRLHSVSSALTVNLVLNLRKFISLVLSVLFFDNDFHIGMGIGGTFVFIGTILYSIGGGDKSSNLKKVDDEIVVNEYLKNDSRKSEIINLKKRKKVK
nr:964_t:CDS:10 [Entrophospora candida]